MSADGETWSQLAAGTTNNTQSQRIIHSDLSGTTEGRYIRVTGTDRWNAAWGNSIYEIEAYGELKSEVAHGSISNFTTTVASDTAVNLAWAYSGSALTGYTLKRDGTTIATPAAGTTTYSDIGLTAGEAYTYTLVGHIQAGGTTPTVSRTATMTNSTVPDPEPEPEPNPDPDPNPNPNPNPTPSNRGWFSGVASDLKGHGADPVKYFSDWRGSPVEIGTTWTNTVDVWGVNPSVADSWSGFQGAMNVAMTQDYTTPANQRFQSWAAEASGAHDWMWHERGQRLRQLRQGRGVTFASLFWEFNGEWMDWSVYPRTSENMANFRTAFKRASDILHEEFPQIKVCLAPALGRDIPEAMIPDASSIDVMTCTNYNAWAWSQNGTKAMERLESYRLKAQSMGKPIGIMEWANSAAANVPGGGGEAPGYITAMHNYFNQHKGTGPGKLWYETYFNIAGYALDHMLLNSNGSVRSTQPNTANRYKELF